ncbi:DnaJ-domain-containing protein [Russula aff. rugulosa BPL654]|nr:DnaJ-domain-containing protein [Russula aff. rugulosa BPL654]
MDSNNPASSFFDEEDVDLYAVLGLESTATDEEIKKVYRKLALIYHPDKHVSSTEDAKQAASRKFQQVGFAYAVLSDKKRRAKYDVTGSTEDGFDLAGGEDGWEAYFEALFESVTRDKLDQMKKEYQGSGEEIDDLKAAYEETSGSLGDIMTHIPHSTHQDEARFVMIISNLITKGELTATAAWNQSSKDEKAKLVRKKAADQEAEEAEELAKELGVWDEFYGSGKEGSRKGKGKGKGKSKGKKKAEGEGEEEEEEDHSALQALILKKRQNAGSFLDNLAAKYAEPQPRAKGKRKKDATTSGEAADESPKKRRRDAEPDIDDEEFAKLQQKLFKDKGAEAGKSTGKRNRAGRGRKS